MEFTKETAQQSRKLIKAMITLGKKSDGQVNELFEIFKPVIHGHDEKAFKAFQSEVCKAAGFENAKQVTEAGCNRFAITVSEFKRYCKEFTGKPESRADLYAELKAAAQAKNKTASGSDGQKPDATPQSGDEAEAPSAIPSGLVNPMLIELFNKAARLSADQQGELAKILADALSK
tara:strand:- start:38 stop:565 length:528 start_codon:yes stop_codon:yes gene_type:complete